MRFFENINKMNKLFTGLNKKNWRHSSKSEMTKTISKYLQQQFGKPTTNGQILDPCTLI
jgi:hypothetical protein